jgi:hypothetical protein
MRVPEPDAALPAVLDAGQAQFRLVMMPDPVSEEAACCCDSNMAWKFTSVSRMGGKPARVQIS